MQRLFVDIEDAVQGKSYEIEDDFDTFVVKKGLGCVFMGYNETAWQNLT